MSMLATLSEGAGGAKCGGSKAATARIVSTDGRKPFEGTQIMRKSILIAASAAIFLTAAPALASPAICIRQDDLYNWNALSDKQVVIENHQHQKALLKLIGACTGLKFHEAMAIRSPGGTALDCVSPGDELSVHDFGGGMDRCAITSVTPYAGNTGKHPAGDHG
jgi:hypothetical protein